MAMRHWTMVACLLWAGGVQAGQDAPGEQGSKTVQAPQASAVAAGTTEYQRGDFRFAVGPVPGFVEQHAIPAHWDPAAPGAHDAPWRFWLNDHQADRRRGRDAWYMDYVYEATSATLLEEAGRFQLQFNPAYQRLTLHAVELRRDGAWQNRLDPARISLARRETGFENNMADGEVTALIVLDDVRVGDVVRIAYSISGSNPILAGQFLERETFAWGSPILDDYLRVLADPGTTFTVRRENAPPEPTITATREAAELDAHRHGAAAVVDEKDYPVWYQPYPALTIGVRRSWAQVAEWALPLYPSSAALPDDLQARIRGWAALPTPRARLTAALRAVQDEVRYFGAELGDNTHRPAPPADTWNNRRGDCKDKAYLLSTVLHALGIDAVPALTSMGRGRALYDIPPSASAFDHVIVRAVIGGKAVWVDPTMSQVGGDAGSTDLSRYGAALPVHAGVTALEPIAPPAGAMPGGVDVTERIVPASDGHFSLEVTSIYRGANADDMRQRFASERRDDVARRYADFYRKRYGELETTAEPAVEDERDANRLTVVEHYRLDAPFDSTDAALRAIDLYPDTVGARAELPATLARTGPMFLATPGEYRHHIDVAVPNGWQPLFGHEEDRAQGSAFDYRRTLDVAKDGAKLEYAFDVRRYDIDAPGVAAEIRALRKVNDSLSARLRYQVPIHMEAGERDRRLKQLLRDAMNQGAGK
jgi:transglutaminase-like putative cysteine protease